MLERGPEAVISTKIARTIQAVSLEVRVNALKLYKFLIAH
jgi:hypothetical protein